MPSKYLHTILVGNVGTVYSGNSTKEARENYSIYRRLSVRDIGRAAGEDVTWMRDGEIYKEYHKRQKPLRTHSEYFIPVSLGNRKSCPHCGEKLDLTESLWGWYEYVRVQKRIIMHFCRHCFVTNVAPRLRAHAGECGCIFNLEIQTSFGVEKPVWLTLEKSV